MLLGKVKFIERSRQEREELSSILQLSVEQQRIALIELETHLQINSDGRIEKTQVKAKRFEKPQRWVIEVDKILFRMERPVPNKSAREI